MTVDGGGMRRALLMLCASLAAAGCVQRQQTPHGYQLVKAFVRPGTRSMAIVPLDTRRGGATRADGLKLAELVAMQLRSVLVGAKVIGPSAMRDLLKDGLNEARWMAIGRELAAELIVVVEITAIDAWHDKELQCREGVIGVDVRVLDVSKATPKRIRDINWMFSFPEELGERFGVQYVGMDDETFRGELLKYAADNVAKVFYDHLKKLSVSSREVRSWVR